jgi:hypothetical protein
MKHIYKALKQRLSTVTTLAQVDWYMGQDENEGEGLVWKTPACYIEFEPIVWTMMGGNVQRGQLVFSLVLVTDGMPDGDRLFESGALDHFAILDSVYRKMQGFRALYSYLSEFSSLAGTANDSMLLESCLRLTTTPIHEQSNLFRSVTKYASTVYDYGAVKTWQQVTAALDVTTELDSIQLLQPIATPPPTETVTILDGDGFWLVDAGGAKITE